MKKFLNVFLIVVAVLFLGVVNVKAGEIDDIFEKVAPNGEFTINFKKPTSSEQLYDYSTTYINATYDKISGYLHSCDEDYTNCYLNLTYFRNNNDHVSDSKMVKVVWNEEYTELFKKVLSSDNILKINYRKPTENEAYDFVRMYIQNKDKNIFASLGKCNADYSECVLSLYDMTRPENKDFSTVYGESNVVKIEWSEEYSDDFKKIAPNNVVTIKNMKPYNYDNTDTSYFSISYFDKYYTNFVGQFSNCNADLSVCDFSLFDQSKNMYGYNMYEVHQVKINWQEEYSDLFKSIAPNGEFKIKSLKPQNEEELEFYSAAAISQTYKNVSGYLSECNKDYTECTLGISPLLENEEGFYYVVNETHRVKVVWEKENPIARKLIDAAIKTLKLGKNTVYNYEDETTGDEYKSVDYYHILEDLNLINLLKNQPVKNMVSYDNAINFVPELKLLFENTNITYNLDTRLGDGEYFYEMGGGQLSLLYKGVVYALVNPYEGQNSSYTSVHRHYVMYIPSNTENTPEAYLKAVKKRLDEYLKEDTKVEIGGLIKDYTKGDKISIPLFEAKDNQIGDYYYKITINDKTYDFLVVRDTAKMVVNNLMKSIDIDTKVKVETTASDVPNDAVINVTTINKENAITTYNKIVETIKTNLFQAFDINLYSETLGTNITKTEKGEFKITLPVADNLKGKDLMVYYIKDDGTLEEHPVTLDEEGNATFTTNHFSTYILAEAIKKEDNSNNVQTGTINPTITNIIMVSSLVGMIYIGKNIKKRVKD